MAKLETHQFVVCIDNKGYETSLETRKIYVAKADAEAAKHGLMRVVDESGDDYLYPDGMFQAISLSAAESKAILAA